MKLFIIIIVTIILLFAAFFTAIAYLFVRPLRNDRRAKKHSKNEEKNYLLNIRTGEIHNLKNQQVNCNIDRIANPKYLSEKEAMKHLELSNAYDGCGHCMKEFSKRKK